MATADAYECPTCRVALRAHDHSWDFSLGTNVALQLVIGVVYVVALAVLWSYGVVGGLVSVLISGVVGVLIAWRIARARRAEGLERYECPKCLSVFTGRQLHTAHLSTHDRAL